MRNRIWMSAWVLAACLPTLALAQQAAPRGAGTWEFSAGGGVKIMDGSLLDYLASGPDSTRFTDTGDPSNIVPAIALRLGYNFSRHLGFSLGAEGAKGSGVTYVTPFAALTYSVNLDARTSPFLTAGTQITRIAGANDRLTHPTWGAHVGVGIRRMISQSWALRLEGRMATEHYAELLDGKATYPGIVTLGLSYFVGGQRPPAPAPPPQTCPVCAAGLVHVDTIMRVRVDTVRVARADTVRITEPWPDQLVLRVQFMTDSTVLLRRTLPVLDTIAKALIATPGSHWEVQGHTDSVGTAEHNRILAQGRAQAVVDYLVRRGVPRSSLTAVGFGEDRPVVSNSTPEGRAQNRRVQLRRIPEGPPPGRPVP